MRGAVIDPVRVGNLHFNTAFRRPFPLKRTHPVFRSSRIESSITTAYWTFMVAFENVAVVAGPSVPS